MASRTLLAGTTPHLDPVYSTGFRITALPWAAELAGYGMGLCPRKSLDVTGKDFQQSRHHSALKLPQEDALQHRHIPVSTYSVFPEGKEAQWDEGKLKSSNS